MCKETNNEEQWHVYIKLPANIFCCRPNWIVPSWWRRWHINDCRWAI